ncbi:MAG: sigma-70 family RNA polymerase sigma factor [Bacteroidetes bacterium]|nr:sigma-70 family RNA polymerase sigma factor [Bacteroidota bacterium]
MQTPPSSEQPDALLKAAQKGDIRAFQELFAPFQPSLKAYLYRLSANRSDAEDLTHDAFIRAFERLPQFRGESSLKTWVFRLATNLAWNMLKRRKRWTVDVSEQAKTLVRSNPELARQIEESARPEPGLSESGRYDIREHVATCFTCMAKTLPLEHEVVLMLKDVYSFSIAEIMVILDKSEGTVKYSLQKARKVMTQIFDSRCALINKTGICHQCSELNGWLNPKQVQQEAAVRAALLPAADSASSRELFALRTRLISGIDPLRNDGSDLQDLLLRCNRMAMGEEQVPGQN